MKKFAKLAAVAFVGMSLMVACKSKPAEQVEDTTPACCAEELMDTIDSVENAVEDTVVKEPVKKAATKAAAKKEEVKNPTKATEMKTGDLKSTSTAGQRSATGVKAEEKKTTTELPATGGSARARR